MLRQLASLPQSTHSEAAPSGHSWPLRLTTGSNVRHQDFDSPEAPRPSSVPFSGPDCLAREIKAQLNGIEDRVNEISDKIDRSLPTPPRSSEEPKARAESQDSRSTRNRSGQEAPDLLEAAVLSPMLSRAVTREASRRWTSSRSNLTEAAQSRDGRALPECVRKVHNAWTVPALKMHLREQTHLVMKSVSRDLKSFGEANLELPGCIPGDDAVLQDIEGNESPDRDSYSKTTGMTTTKSTEEGDCQVESMTESSFRRENLLLQRRDTVSLFDNWRSSINWENFDEGFMNSGGRLLRKRAFTRSVSQEVEDLEQSLLWKWVHGLWFQVITSTVIVSNAFYIGLRAELRMQSELRGEKEDAIMGYIEWGFFCFFTTELLIRLIAEQRLFFLGPEWRWNAFDSVLVVLSTVDVVLNGMTNGGVGNMITARMIRFVRFIRIIRIARAVRAFYSLRIVVFAIFASMANLFWCFVVVFLIIYVFAIFFQNGVMEHIMENGGTKAGMEEMLDLYGSVLRAMVTLFMTITGGIDWRDAMRPLKVIHMIYEPIFNFYVFFMVIGVLNVVVGAFVATTTEISSKDREVLVKAEMSNMVNYKKNIKAFFAEADKDRSGKLSWEEFKEHLKIPKVAAFFRSLELDVSQAHVVFRLLDSDANNEVSLDEFISGCMRLRGQAKSIDVNMLLYENKRLYSRLSDFVTFVSQLLVADKELSGMQFQAKNSIPSLETPRSQEV